MTLRRSGPPKRKTPLAARTPLVRSSQPMKRTAMVRTPAKTSKPKPRKDPIPRSERKAVRVRSGGLCEARIAMACTGRGEQLHHRKLRRHGDHRAINLLDVCSKCHPAIHNPTSVGLPASWSYDHGFLLRSTDDPELILANRNG